MTMTHQLEAIARRLDLAGVPDPAIEARAAREAADTEVAARLAAINAERDRIARDWLSQAARVEAAVSALVDANAELERIADLDDDAYRAAWQLSVGRPADPRCPGGLPLPILPATLPRLIADLIDQAARFGIRERAARAGR